MASSIARKYIMGLSGLFLVTFLFVHLLINLLTLLPDPSAFNSASHFMGHNPIIQVMQFVLAAGFLIHIIWGIILHFQNKSARPEGYAYNQPSKNASFASRNMVVTGILILLFTGLHLKDYLLPIKMGLPEGMTDYQLVVNLFQSPIYTAIYVIAFILLAIHLSHGFQSAFQSLGAKTSKYNGAIEKSGVIYFWMMSIGFSSIALFHFIQSLTA